jgi:uncharacterized protein
MNAQAVPSKNDDFATRGKLGQPLNDYLVIDAHAHLSATYAMPYVSSKAESIVAVLDRIGIRRAYVSSIEAIYARPQVGNDEVIAAVRRYPDRLRGYMVANVSYAEMILPELERCYAAGLRAVKILSYGNRKALDYDHPNYDLVFRFANERGLPLLAHTWGRELDQLGAAFGKYPQIRWILAHTGSTDLHKYVRAAHAYPHVYLETCFSRCPRGFFERLVQEVPLHKILWGSDQVFLGAAQQIGRVLLAQITPAQKRAILGENAARVLGD